MVLNHIDLQVTDVQRAARFFEEHFGFAMQTSRTSPAIAVLGGEGGVVLVLQRKEADSHGYPDGFHVGFLVDTEAKVVDMQRRLTEAGAQVSGVDRNNRGTMMYCNIGDGIAIEVSCRKKR